MIYLASPFSHADPAVRRWRYEQALDYTAHSIRKGLHVFSPIAYGFHIAELLGSDTAWETWEALDLDFLARCDELWVLMLPGWNVSKGVAAEVKFAEERGMAIHYLKTENAPRPLV